MKDFELKPTQFGFHWGPVEVTRVASDQRGGVWISLETKRGIVQIRVTPGGRFQCDAVGWKPPAKPSPVVPMEWRPLG